MLVMSDKRLQKKILEIAEAVLNCPTAPYREQILRKYIKAFCKERAIAVRQDEMGNLITTYGTQYGKEVLAFEAHMDHPGFIVEEDSKNKKASAVFYGGVEKDYFKNAKVRVFSDRRQVSGQIIKIKFERKKFIKRVWLKFEDEVKRGDLAMWDLPAFKVRRGKLYSRACDDCVGCAALLCLFDGLVQKGIKKKVSGIFTVAEEAGLHGAKFLCTNKEISRQTAIITIETSMQLPGAELGDGVVVRVGDLQNVFNPDVTEFIRASAKRIKREDKMFCYQRKLMDAGTCESSIYQDFGYLTGAVCIPLANYHNRNSKSKKIEAEYVSIADLVNLVKLLAGLVEDSSQFKKLMKTTSPKYISWRRSLGERFFW